MQDVQAGTDGAAGGCGNATQEAELAQREMELVMKGRDTWKGADAVGSRWQRFKRPGKWIAIGAAGRIVSY